MNKKDAANYLGISPRTLEWHTKQGNVGVRYVKGKTGDVADYDDGELRALKAKLDGHRAPRAAVVREGHESSETEPRSLARLADLQPDQFAEMLARAYSAGVGEVMQRLPALLPPADGNAPAVPLADKLTLNLTEAAQLSGLSRAHLRQAIGERKLKARIIGRGWRVKRSDLEAYVTKL
jgi:excisionase family DNA binding protein